MQSGFTINWSVTSRKQVYMQSIQFVNAIQRLLIYTICLEMAAINMLLVAYSLDEPKAGRSVDNNFRCLKLMKALILSDKTLKLT